VNEFELIYELIAPHAGARDDVLLGIGDDGAVVAPPPGESLVIVVDTVVAGRHFPPDLPAADIGYRVAAVNLSDIAAMAATPLWATLALTIPTADPDWVREFVHGLSAALLPAGTALVGGDTTRGPLSASVQIVGSLPPGTALTRHGARPGDLVCVSGTLGDAAAGLALWPPGPHPASARETLLERFRRPQPRLALGQRLRGLASSCIDVSDGLLAEAGHLARRSGCRLVLEAARLPLSAALRAVFPEREALEFALTGGDDYELCFTLPSSALAALTDPGLPPITPIGRVETGSGVDVLGPDGAPMARARPGFDHFAGAP
jgi:thiamine-monophosphate kinase